MLRALALGLPNKKVLYVTLRSTFRSGRWPLDSQIGSSRYVNPEEHVSFRALALRLPIARLWCTGNLDRKGTPWQQKRSRAARLGGVAGVRPGGETLVDKARSRRARLGGVAGVRPGGETLVDR